MKEILFEVTNKRIYQYFFLSIIKVLSIFVIVLYLYIYLNSYSLRQILIPVLVGFLYVFIFVLFPLIILFINHRNNSNGTLFFDLSKGEYIFSSNEEITRFTTDEIEKVIYKQSQPINSHREINWLFWDKYYYIVIILKNSKIVKLSCLMDINKSDFLPKDKVRIERKIFPFIPK